MVARSLPPQPALPVRPPLPFVTHAGGRACPCSTSLLLRIRPSKCSRRRSSLACSPVTPAPYRTRRTTDLSGGGRTPTPGREKRRFCAGFLLSWEFEEDGRGHGLGGGGSSRPHREVVHGSKSVSRKKRTWSWISSLALFRVILVHHTFPYSIGWP